MWIHLFKLYVTWGDLLMLRIFHKNNGKPSKGRTSNGTLYLETSGTSDLFLAVFEFIQRQCELSRTLLII